MEVDIGCGIKVITLGNINDINLDFVKLDNFIYNSISHDTGRLLSRNKAIESISLEKFEGSMKEIYTTSVCKGQLMNHLLHLNIVMILSIILKKQVKLLK